MNGVRYEVRKDNTAARWDWLNDLTGRRPYSVYEWRESTGTWWPLGFESTMRGVRDRVRRIEALRSEAAIPVYRENDGSPELDLREWALSHGYA